VATPVFLQKWPTFALSGLVLVLAAMGCGGDPAVSDPQVLEASQGVDRFDVPIAGISAQFEADFNDGDLLFSTPMRAADGLGPLYVRSSCDSCHDAGNRGPGFVQKMSVVEADGVTPAADQSVLAFGHTLRPLTEGEGATPLGPPADAPNVKVTVRIGPPILGRGYVEAIDDSEIERVAALQAERDDGVHGRVNHVLYQSEPDPDARFGAPEKGASLIGRFGLKARIATLDDFVADAFQGDMGITSPFRPNELDNPDHLSDDTKPGIDVGYDSVTLRAMYVRLLAIPVRHLNELGSELFESTGCSTCHVPSMKTRADYPIPELSGIDAYVYSDLLLHRMGTDLADGLPADPSVDGEADSFDWRTAPLIGLRFSRTYLHDGRAKTIEDAVLMHRGSGSEANFSIDRFEELSTSDRETLLDFVAAL